MNDTEVGTLASLEYFEYPLHIYKKCTSAETIDVGSWPQ